MACFMGSEILSPGTTVRRPDGAYRYAMGLPAESSMVLICGTCPWASTLETLSTVSPASFDSKPVPPTIGNMRPASSTPAIRQHPPSLTRVLPTTA